MCLQIKSPRPSLSRECSQLSHRRGPSGSIRPLPPLAAKTYPSKLVSRSSTHSLSFIIYVNSTVFIDFVFFFRFLVNIRHSGLRMLFWSVTKYLTNSGTTFSLLLWISALRLAYPINIINLTYVLCWS